MGSSSTDSKTHSTQNTNYNQTTTPTNPQWVTDGMGAWGANVNKLNSLDPSNLVSGPNATQTGAAGMLSNLGGVSNNNLTTGGNLQLASIKDGFSGISASAQAPATSQLISHFLNPNLQSVVNPALAAYDYGAGRNAAQEALTQAGTDSAFGGSGAALAAAATAAQNNLGRGQLASQLYGDAYNSALQGAQNQGALIMQARQQNLQGQIAQNAAEQQQAALRQSAGTNLANIGLGMDQNTRANATTQMGIGDNLRQIQQEQNLAPLTTAATIGGIYSSAPLSLLHGQDTSGNQNTTSDSTQHTEYTPSLMSQIGQGLSLGGQFAAGLSGMGLGLPGMGGGGAAAGGGGIGGSFIPSATMNPASMGGGMNPLFFGGY